MRRISWNEKCRLSRIQLCTHNCQNVFDVIDIELCVTFAELLEWLSEPPQFQLLQFLPTSYIFSSHKFNDCTRQCQSDENVHSAKEHEMSTRNKVTKSNSRHGDKTEIKSIEESPIVLPLIENSSSSGQVKCQENHCTHSVEKFPPLHFFPHFFALSIFIACNFFFSILLKFQDIPFSYDLRNALYFLRSNETELANRLP